MAYTDIDKPSDYFETVLYTGNQTARNITMDFAPNWVWIKKRTGASGTSNHYLLDSVRGANKVLYSNATNAEETNTNSVTAFNSDGFSLGNDTDVNVNSGTFASWNWKAGTSFTNDASGTGIGSIDSTGSVNNDAGFSIVSYTGNSPTATTIKHGLNSVPQMIIFKRRVGAGNWVTYHQATGNTKALVLNTAAAPDTSAGYFNNTTPTSSVFSVANSGDTNSNGNAMIAYCFSEKQGYSKISSYVGNGNVSGTYVHLGFKPAFVIQKQSSASGEYWMMKDNKRETGNQTDANLYPNASNAEGDTNGIDLLSNGFKCRTSGAGSNGSGATYIYMAFAENPFVSSSGVPATAR